MSALCVITFFIFLLFPTQAEQKTFASDFLRIHIRANSNSSVDQAVKYEIKDEIVGVLTPLLSEVNSKKEATNVISQNIKLIESTANKVLAQKGFSYCSKANITQEFFPTRSYNKLTLDSGVYDAIILNLGSGMGDNWWCVVYPPMCFVPSEGDGQNIEFKSKIIEIIKNFFK